VRRADRHVLPHRVENHGRAPADEGGVPAPLVDGRRTVDDVDDEDETTPYRSVVVPGVGTVAAAHQTQRNAVHVEEVVNSGLSVELLGRRWVSRRGVLASTYILQRQLHPQRWQRLRASTWWR
jgi:hypothetical protein